MTTQVVSDPELHSDGVPPRMTRPDLAETERRRLRALVDADLALADRFHADDFQLITPGGDALSKDEYLGGIASGSLDYLAWDPEEIDARVLRDSGCLRYRSTIKILVDGREIGPVAVWHTDFYEWRVDRWQVVWSQATQAAP
jgi:uncharacterized protein DUF4440